MTDKEKIALLRNTLEFLLDTYKRGEKGFPQDIEIRFLAANEAERALEETKEDN
jgi:hypothetical protein